MTYFRVTSNSLNKQVFKKNEIPNQQETQNFHQ